MSHSVLLWFTEFALNKEETFYNVTGPQTSAQVMEKCKYHPGLGTQQVGINTCQNESKDIIH